MATLQFTPNLSRILAVPEGSYPGGTVAEVLAAAFATAPRVRGYVLDETGALRTHVTVFVDGQMIRDRRRLSDAVAVDSSVFVMQALSGG
jgi:hypothetical protein